MRRSISICAAVIAVLLAAAASATRVQRLSLSELRDQAAAVVVAEVIGQATRLDPGGRMPWTDYELHVEEVLAGGATLGPQTLSFAGGTVDGTAAGIAGVPVLEVGKRYVLFLQPTGKPWATPIIGWGQGILEIVDFQSSRAAEALVSYDGEPLLASADGLRRGGRVRVEGGQLAELADGDGRRGSPRAAEPVVLDATGAAIVQRERALLERPQPLEERPFASLDELRLFVRGELAEAPNPGRGRR